MLIAYSNKALYMRLKMNKIRASFLNKTPDGWWFFNFFAISNENAIGDPQKC